MIEKNAPLVETGKKERYLKYCVSATDLLLMKEEEKIHLEVTETFRSRSKLAFRCIFLIVGSMSPDSSKSIFTFWNPQAEHRNFYQCEFVLPARNAVRESNVERQDEVGLFLLSDFRLRAADASYGMPCHIL